MYYVYVLACGDGSLYTGMTNDLRRRMTLPRAAKLALLDVPEQVGQVFPALAQYDYAPVRGETLAHLLEEGSNG